MWFGLVAVTVSVHVLTVPPLLSAQRKVILYFGTVSISAENKIFAAGVIPLGVMRSVRTSSGAPANLISRRGIVHSLYLSAFGAVRLGFSNGEKLQRKTMHRKCKNTLKRKYSVSNPAESCIESGSNSRESFAAQGFPKIHKSGSICFSLFFRVTFGRRAGEM